MKEIKKFMHLDVWKLTEPVKYDSDVATIYFAPKQNWDEKSRDMMREEEGVFIGNRQELALMIREKGFVLGGASEGTCYFAKTTLDRQFREKQIYEKEYPVNDGYSSAREICDLFRQAGLI